MFSFIKKSLAIFMLIFCSTSYSDLGDVRRMTQPYPGDWKVICNDGRVQRAKTSDILANEVCKSGHSGDYLLQCVEAVKRPLGSFEYDDKDEIMQIIRACRGSRHEVPKCIDNTVAKLGIFEVDDREEIIEIVMACKGGLGNINKCMKAVQVQLGTFQNDDREEMIELLNSCKYTTLQEITCFNLTVSNMSTISYDERQEVIEILNSCKY